MGAHWRGAICRSCQRIAHWRGAVCRACQGMARGRGGVCRVCQPMDFYRGLACRVCEQGLGKPGAGCRAGRGVPGGVGTGFPVENGGVRTGPLYTWGVNGCRFPLRWVRRAAWGGAGICGQGVHNERSLGDWPAGCLIR